MENKPICIIDKYGNKEWILDGEKHREDGPAVEYADGSYEWWVNGEIHHEGGPAAYYKHNNKIHQYWYSYGKIHRFDGPAVIKTNDTPRWWINNFDVTLKITKWAIDNEIDLDNLSEVDIALIKITFT